MFARHTQTRMKGSAVVNGLKSLASRIHEQLPLSPRESSRLLTALTSSFRKHLDEVHPKNASEDVRPKLNGSSSTSKFDRHAMSSAALADKHLASVLTNPLLAKSTSTSTRASEQAALIAAFEKSEDPIALLEFYGQNGQITPAAAHACAKKYEQIFKDVPHAQQVKIAKETRFGSRLLACFWRAKLHESAEFVDMHGLRESLVWAVMLEGREEFLWEWLKLDLKLMERDYVVLNETVRRDSRGQYTTAGRKYSDYRWKGRLLRAMIETGFRPPHSEHECADAALGIYLAAVRLRKHYAQDRHHHMCWLPLEPARNIVCQQLMRAGRPWRNTHPHLYDEVIESLNANSENAMVALSRAELWLHHPTRPTAVHHYALLWRLYSGDLNMQHDDMLLRLIETPKTKGTEVKMFKIFLFSSLLLRAQGLQQEADWMRALTHDSFPALRKHTQEDLASLQEQHHDILSKEQDTVPSQQEEADQSAFERVALPWP